MTDRSMLAVDYFFYSYAAHRDLHSFPTRRSSDLLQALAGDLGALEIPPLEARGDALLPAMAAALALAALAVRGDISAAQDRKSTRLNSSHMSISYAVFCLKKKNKQNVQPPAQRLL